MSGAANDRSYRAFRAFGRYNALKDIAEVGTVARCKGGFAGPRGVIAYRTVDWLRRQNFVKEVFDKASYLAGAEITDAGRARLAAEARS